MASPPRARPRIGAAILATGVLLGGTAAAQDPPAPPPAPAPTAPAPAATAAPPPPAPARAGKQTAPVPPRAAGAPRWKGKRAALPKGKRAQELLPAPGTPIASFPGFTRLDDGKTRIFVEVSQKVPVTEQRTAGRVTYRLQGAAVVQRTNQLSLVTNFFNTPVARVQLVPMGPDLDVVIELRESTEATFAVADTPRGMVLWVDFPRSVNFGRDDHPEPERPRSRRGVDSRTLGGLPPPSDAPAPIDD